MSGVFPGTVDLGIGAVLLLAAAGLSLALRMGVHRALLWSAARMALQLVCVGYVLRFVFLSGAPLLTAGVVLIMVASAAWEVGARQGRRDGYGANLLALVLSAGGISLIAVLGVAGPGALSDPQAVIPIFGIILGTAMNSAALTLHALGVQVTQGQAAIEAQLALGRPLAEALRPAARAAIASGTIPILNQMAGAGLITLPGIMSGQILAGADPMRAALSQIFLMSLLAAASVICVALSIYLFRRRISDDRQRLRLDAIAPSGGERAGWR